MTEKSILKKAKSSHTTGASARFVNLCPHKFDLYDRKTDKLVLSIPPSGTICNVEFDHEPIEDEKNPLVEYGVEAFHIPRECKLITGLPDFNFVKDNNLLLFVSCVVQQAVSITPKYKKYEPYLVVATLDRKFNKRDSNGIMVGNYSISMV